MAGLKTVSAALVVLLAAAIYQTRLHTFTMLGLGLLQKSEPLSSFPYTCRRVDDERLQACEDMWLSERSRRLFLGCSDPLGKKEWCPQYVPPVEPLALPCHAMLCNTIQGILV